MAFEILAIHYPVGFYGSLNVKLLNWGQFYMRRYIKTRLH